MRFFHQEKVSPTEIPALILATRQDLVVTPFEKQFVKEPDVTNVLLQYVYPDVKASHSGLMHVSEAIKLIHEFFEAP